MSRATQIPQNQKLSYRLDQDLQMSKGYPHLPDIFLSHLEKEIYNELNKLN